MTVKRQLVVQLIELTSPSGYNNTFMTDATGQYTFTNVPTADAYTIRPERNDDHMNGVSTLDLVRIQKHLLGSRAVYDSIPVHCSGCKQQ